MNYNYFVDLQDNSAGPNLHLGSKDHYTDCDTMLEDISDIIKEDQYLVNTLQVRNLFLN